MDDNLDQCLRTLTIAQVAERLQVRIRTVYALIKRGELRAIKIGRVWRIPLKALDNYLEGSINDTESSTSPLSAKEVSDIQASLEARERGAHITLEELERKFGL